MTSERWRRLQEIFLAAAALSQSDQQAFLETSCGDDAALLADALGMLKMDMDGHPLLGTDLPAVAARVFEDEQDHYLGRTFGAYRFKSRLGEGGMSWVYLAERPEYDGIVAVKVLRGGLSPERRQLFDYEKKLLAQLNHPAIARLYDAGMLDDGAAFFAMEYVDGLSLTEYCRQRKLDLGGRLALFRQVCEAVGYAHGRGIIHRDLKPSNILVQADGVVKLLDFGVSERIDEARTTNLSSSYMTLAYAAPEQIRHEAGDVRVDIYSLGVILQQLLTGELPFDLTSKSNADIREEVLNQPPRKPSSVVRRRSLSAGAVPDGDSHLGIDPKTLTQMDWQDIDHICSMALAKQATARFASVESLMRELDRFLQRQPLESRRQNRAYVGTRFIQRHRQFLSLATLAACAVVGLTVFYTLRITRARNEALAEAARTERVQKFMERLLLGDDANNGPPVDLRVVTVLENGVRDARALNTDPPIQAELYQTIAGIYGAMGNFKVAEPLYHLALDKETALYGAQSAQVADTLVNLGGMRLNEGKLAEAEETIQKALMIDRSKLPPDHPQTTEASIALGVVLVNRGAYKEAVSILEKAINLESGKNGSAYDLSLAVSSLANANYYLGNLDKSEELDFQSFEIDRKLKGDENIDIAEDLMSLGSLHERMGRLPKAEEEERRALSIEQHWYRSEDHREVASAMTILAQTLSKEEKYSEALPLVEGALSMRLRMHGPPSAAFAHTWSAKGQIEESLGRFDDAEKDDLKALEMYRQVLPGQSYQAGVCLDNLSATSFARKQYERAEQFSREALQMLMSKLPPDDAMIAIAEMQYGRALMASNHLAQAEEQYLAAYTVLNGRKGQYETELKTLRQYLVTLYQLQNQPERARFYQQ